MHTSCESSNRPADANFPCPGCGGRVSLALWADQAVNGFAPRRCATCDLVFTTPPVPPESLDVYYPETYYGQRNVRFKGIFEWLVHWFSARRVRKICGMHAPGRVLDIGCGRGQFLDQLRSLGWQALGAELNAHAACHAREVLHLDVTVGPFDPRAYAPHSLDAIVLWHVLEHLPHPDQVFQSAANLLQPGGILVIAVPNFASWQARFSGTGWFHLDIPRHLSHFSESWLRTRLAAVGFRIAEVNHYSLEQNPFGWIQSVLNRLGFERNLLYDILKDRAARTIRQPFRRFPVQSLLSLGGAVLLLPFACLMSVIDAAFGRGATIEIYAIATDAATVPQVEAEPAESDTRTLTATTRPISR